MNPRSGHPGQSQQWKKKKTHRLFLAREPAVMDGLASQAGGQLGKLVLSGGTSWFILLVTSLVSELHVSALSHSLRHRLGLHLGLQGQLCLVLRGQN